MQLVVVGYEQAIAFAEDGTAARLYGLGLAQAGLDFRRYALEQWLERFEVFARLAIRDLLGGALLGAGADMAQERDVVRIGYARQLGGQAVDVDGFICRRGIGRRSGE